MEKEQLPPTPAAPPLSTRKVWASDLPYLKSLFSEAGMPLPPKKDLMRGILAVNDADEPVGFIRVLQVNNDKNPAANGNYVYPIVVFESWQGHGAGRLLIEKAHAHYGELRLVACRSSRDFYPKCGFEPLAWEEVAHTIVNDCQHCPDLEDCNPQPYIKPA